MFMERIQLSYIIDASKSILKLKAAEFQVDSETGFISKIFMNGKEIDFSQEFLYYKGFVGDNKKFSNRSSGAYIFRPDGTAYRVADKASIKIYRGVLVAELHQQFTAWISQVIRVYANENFIEFDWVIGPIPTDGYTGKEVITRYTTSLNTNSFFYTDSNGRSMLKRIRNFRPAWNVSLKEPISGNYYPVTSKIVIRDGDTEVAVLPDRAQGGTSLQDGQIELMLHRTCLHDDAFGVAEALIEKAYNKGLVARGSHYVILGSTTTSNEGGVTAAAQERNLAQRKLLDAWTFLSPTNGLSYDDYKKKYVMEYAGLKRALPDNVQILTLEPWKGFSFLLRLEHVFESNDDPALSQTVTVDLKITTEKQL
ncbi:hypothetical protein NQ318_012284 [Aromia moschata]|uniref:Glycosyl hydrolase family 38 C-terminal domain-containing protein n=1 Tax=Aromia moschata TaxID=1265417 RepID=A0AAV8YJ49_9CUCU|nr:hypothetical protein NQ318_012284 [Aromia moschata]